MDDIYLLPPSVNVPTHEPVAEGSICLSNWDHAIFESNVYTYLSTGITGCYLVVSIADSYGRCPLFVG